MTTKRQRAATPRQNTADGFIPHRLSFKRLPDGRRLIGIITSNSYRDRDGEYITTEALQAWVESCWKAADVFRADNPVLFWHDGPPIADVVYAEVDGPFLVELAVERRTPFAKAVLDHVEASPGAFGASHGFEHYEEEPRGARVYHAIRKFETSILPLEYAANSITFTEVFNE
jgi:hypothetical protein